MKGTLLRSAPGHWRLNRPFALVLGCLSVALTAREAVNALTGHPTYWSRVSPLLCALAAVGTLAVALASRRQPPLVRGTHLAGALLLALIALDPWLHPLELVEGLRWVMACGIGLSFLVGTWPSAPTRERGTGLAAALALTCRPLFPPEGSAIPLFVVGAVVVHALIATAALRERVEREEAEEAARAEAA